MLKNTARIILVCFSVLCVVASCVVPTGTENYYYSNRKEEGNKEIVIEPIETTTHTLTTLHRVDKLVFGFKELFPVFLPNEVEDTTSNNETTENTEKETVAVEDNTEEEIVFSPNVIRCAWGDFTLTMDDFNLLCTTVFCEAGNQSIETQVMTALTVLNRVVSEDFPNNIRGVVYGYNAYEVTNWHNFEGRGWTEQVEMAVTYALERNDYPTDMYFFRTKHFHKFGKPYMQSGALYFSTKN